MLASPMMRKTQSRLTNKAPKSQPVLPLQLHQNSKTQAAERIKFQVSKLHPHLPSPTFNYKKPCLTKSNTIQALCHTSKNQVLQNPSRCICILHIYLSLSLSTFSTKISSTLLHLHNPVSSLATSRCTKEGRKMQVEPAVSS